MKFGSTPLDLVIIGRSILSSLENPAAGLYRGLINELAQHGHRTTFLERLDPTRVQVRDMLRSPYCEVWTYPTTEQLLEEYTDIVQTADVIMMGSGVEDAEDIAVWIAEEARGVTIYYDTNLNRTIESFSAARKLGDCLSCRTIGNFNLFLSTTGGPILEELARENDLQFARPLYESVDPFDFYRTDAEKTYELGFIGTYKEDRRETLTALLLEPAGYTPARNFVLAGSGYIDRENWPTNLTYLEHLPATNLVDFYNRQVCTLVINRADRQAMGYTPTRRLMAAAACGVPVLTTYWAGLEHFLEPDREVYTVDDRQSVLDILYGSDEKYRRKMGNRARKRILAEHTIGHRAQELLGYLSEVTD
ncbi:CgeB family protein [Neolewinella antarctica]|uniref:Spore maturation protein CgeB n=1 Tax=Neolewinella antarctica TaxID=442734 RepID=A0ABX0XB82_9BACT|nr:glycosyltransferase [Neolewinella antarctica]NJC26226.1 spore maturation protein CgeB [Neolewinella antarctica]